MFKKENLSNHLYMTKNKVIGFLDKLFISVILFLLIYAWINFFIRNLVATFILSFLFTFAVSFVLFFFLNKRNEKCEFLKQFMKDANENFLAFRLMHISEQIALINKAISQKYNTRIFNNSIVYKDRGVTHKILFATHLETVSQFNLINLLQGIKNVDRVIIICNQIEPNLNVNFLKNTVIEFVEKTKLYNDYFLAHNVYPNTKILNTKIQKKKMREVLKNFFTPAKAKSYFLCGLILIFSSLILPYHCYYLIFGSCFLVASLACKIIPLFGH